MPPSRRRAVSFRVDSERVSRLRTGSATRICLAALALTAAASTSGCGRGTARELSKAAYEQRIQALYAPVREAFQRTAGKHTLRELSTRVAAAQSELRAAADAIERLQPPADAREPTEALAAGLRRYAQDLESLRAAAAAGRAGEVARFGAKTRPPVRAIQEAAEELMRRGYRLGALKPD